MLIILFRTLFGASNSATSVEDEKMIILQKVINFEYKTEIACNEIKLEMGFLPLDSLEKSVEELIKLKTDFLEIEKQLNERISPNHHINHRLNKICSMFDEIAKVCKFDFYDFYMDKLVKLQRLNILKDTKQKILKLKEEIKTKILVITLCIEKLNVFVNAYFDLFPFESEIFNLKRFLVEQHQKLSNML
ncbi:hypothetical protein EHP00_2700 [Ecytonucleospora hepatopenaei]|uniref:Uncharacterized protein n=1 Tax=Ecytonucleospora hepatopenaei TaxID=646526 RepID=A0A1W0E607_9MICR|nr:hypothetical protein EHP00_770 [Ecytonucleospora hepatopenaei]OQS55309.1 hypothetical protein EHP00_2700 [Ecytonucleospora hepatopenaei]